MWAWKRGLITSADDRRNCRVSIIVIISSTGMRLENRTINMYDTNRNKVRLPQTTTSQYSIQFPNTNLRVIVHPS